MYVFFFFFALIPLLCSNLWWENVGKLWVEHWRGRKELMTWRATQFFSFVSRERRKKNGSKKGKQKNVITFSLDSHANDCCSKRVGKKKIGFQTHPKPSSHAHTLVNDTMRHLILLIISQMLFPSRLLKFPFAGVAFFWCAAKVIHGNYGSGLPQRRGDIDCPSQYTNITCTSLSPHANIIRAKLHSPHHMLSGNIFRFLFFCVALWMALLVDIKTHSKTKDNTTRHCALVRHWNVKSCLKHYVNLMTKTWCSLMSETLKSRQSGLHWRALKRAHDAWLQQQTQKSLDSERATTHLAHLKKLSARW